MVVIVTKEHKPKVLQPFVAQMVATFPQVVIHCSIVSRQLVEFTTELSIFTANSLPATGKRNQ